MTVSDPLHERRLKLTFLNVAATSVPLVARLATEEGISANVISATTQKLSDEFTEVCCSVFRTVNLTRQPLFLKTLKTLRLRR